MRIEVACTISNFSAMRTEVVAVAHPVEGPKEQVESFQTFFTVGLDVLIPTAYVAATYAR